MDSDTSPVPRLPSLNRLQFAMLVPIAGVALATVLFRIHVLTAVATFLGSFAVPLLSHRGYVVSLHPVPNRSWLHAEFKTMYQRDEFPPTILQRWYARLGGAVIGACVAEFLQAVFILHRAGVTPRFEFVAGPIAVGMLEGAFLKLLATLVWALGSLVLLVPRAQRAA